VAVTIGAAWVLGIGTVLSFNAWSGWYPLGFVPAFAEKTFFDVLDYVSANILPPIGALLTSVLVGWRLSHAIVNEELAETTPFARKVFVWLLRYVCPIAITTMLISALASV
jgi:NSS family neurotransmitter:Na+ symporter